MFTKFGRTIAVLAATAGCAGVAVTAAPAQADAATHIPRSLKSCGQNSVNHLGVLANRRTSCPFARAVSNRYAKAQSVELRPGMWGPRSHTYRVYSRATGGYITMRCRLVMTPDSPFGLCTGGNGAGVYTVS